MALKQPSNEEPSRSSFDGRHPREIERDHIERVRARVAKLHESIGAAVEAPTLDTLAAVVDDARWTRLDVDTALALKGHVADLRDAHWTTLQFTTPADALATFESFASAPTSNYALIEMRNLRARVEGLLKVARGYHALLRS